MSRRHTQAENRKANKFGLKPFVPALTLTAQQYVDGLAAHVKGQIAVVAGPIDPAHIIDFDAMSVVADPILETRIIDGTNALIDKADEPRPMRWFLKNPDSETSTELVPTHIELKLLKNERGFYTFEYPDGTTKRYGRRQVELWLNNFHLTVQA